MGESTNPRTTLRFDRRIRLEFRGATITSDAGLLACRELDDALGLTETADECLQESRGGRNVQHRLVGFSGSLRQSVPTTYSRLQRQATTVYRYVCSNCTLNQRLSDDPTMRVVVGDRGIDRPAASTNTMSRFETEVLTQDGNVEGLGRLNSKWVDRAMSRTPHRRVILDMDSSESPVQGASYNGHFGSTCYHPLYGKRDPDGAVTRRYLEINVAFYVTAGVTVLFLHNWFSLLALGGDSLEGNHQAWVIWAVVDVVLPLVVGVTGCRLWREASRP